MTIKDVVLRQWTTAVENDSTWHVPLVNALRGLTAAQAASKPAPERHSIWQIVRHLTDWKHAVIERWRGGSPDLDAVAAADWREVSGDEPAWQADVQALLQVSREMREMIEGWDDEELIRPTATPTAGPSPRPKVFTALDMACHDAYHSGQIRYLRALQGG